MLMVGCNQDCARYWPRAEKGQVFFSPGASMEELIEAQVEKIRENKYCAGLADTSPPIPRRAQLFKDISLSIERRGELASL